MAVGDWSTDPSQNSSIGGTNIAENCPAGNVNNAIRELMAQIAVWSANNIQAKDAALTSLADLVNGPDLLPYFTGTDTFGTIAISAFMRGLLASTDAAAASSALGVIKVSAVLLANPGYIRFQITATTFFQINFGTASFPPGGSNVLYAANFPNVGFPFISGGGVGMGNQINDPAVVGGTSAPNGFSVNNPFTQTKQGYYLAVGY